METVSGVSNSVSGDIQNASAGKKKLGKNYAFLPLSCVKPVIYLDGIEWIVECRRALEILINSWIYLVS